MKNTMPLKTATVSTADQQKFKVPDTPTARLSYDTILLKPTNGIPTRGMNIMEHSVLERLAGVAPGTYVKKPEATYHAAQIAMGTCCEDQWIPLNPLTMGSHGYDSATAHGSTTGASEIVLDGIKIDSPEAVAEHLERFIFPQIQADIQSFDEATYLRKVIDYEINTQNEIGPQILKAPYSVWHFPGFRYGKYGYEGYFTAFALFPELMEKDFSLQADLAVIKNRAVRKAYETAGLPPYARLDHDMADSRGTLVRIKMLDKLWLPHFVRSLEPARGSGVRMIWHCDGNLMQMVPRLLDAGLCGFQGFQYEDGMDYVTICKMKTRDGDPLLIQAGVSVTTTLPFGSPDEVRNQLDWLVENGPKRGLFLGASSSVAPGTPWKNIETLIDGLRYYRERNP